MPDGSPPALPWDACTMERALTSVARRVDLAAALAADWMQEARLHLLVHGPTIAACFRGDALAETYLHAVLRNHCVNWLKARRRAVPRALGVEQVPRRLRRALEVRDPDPLETTEAGAVSAQREAAFWHAWESLSANDRALLWEYYAEERPMPVVARALGCSPDAGYKRVQRLVARLRKQCGIRPPPHPTVIRGPRKSPLGVKRDGGRPPG